MTGATLTRRQTQDLLDRYDIHPSKARGQHFLVEPSSVAKVVRVADIGPGDRVIEVGAGLGHLTLALAGAGATVRALEVDRRLLEPLREVTAGTEVEIIQADAMAVDWAELAPGHGWALVANLPYNIATPLVLDVLAQAPGIARMLVMVQREVGERLVATPGGGAYGAVSVKLAYWAGAATVGRVGPSVFLPPPRVESVLVRIDRHPGELVVGPDLRPWLFRLVAAGFGHRRKMLRRSLAGLVTPEVMEGAGIRPQARAEELALEDWARLARCSSPPPTVSSPSPS